MFLLAALLCSINPARAQQPQKKQTAEMKQEIESLRKEIKDLENEIKQLEQSDPEEAAVRKKELAALKNMLAMMGGVPAQTEQPPKPALNTGSPVKPSHSPIVPIALKQPVTIPTAAQVKDRLLWYSGKKLNDSTLVTARGLLVQYSGKRSMVIVQPPKKSDRFEKMVNELVNNEKRKNELAERFVAIENGFLYYPLIVTAIAVYDNLSLDFSRMVKNTIELPAIPAQLAANESNATETYARGHGPNQPSDFFDAEGGKEHVDLTENLKQYLNEQLALAKQLIQQLPPVESFPAPPVRQLGFCATCDTSILSRERRQDSIWIEKYQGLETRISSIILGMEHVKSLLGVNDNSSYFDLLAPIFSRMKEKDKILLEKYGNDIRTSQVIASVVLGHERQRQLLGIDGNEEPSLMAPIVRQVNDAYKKYFDEQVEAKNHDFVLNLPSHIGVLRQQALLGFEEGTTLSELLDTFFDYNRFALTTEIDFIYEQVTDDNEIELKATGTLESSVKKYGMLIFDSCKTRMIPYTRNINSQTIEKVTMDMTVKAGTKTMRDEEGKLVTYRYSGPESFPLQFPEYRIDFCNTAKPDTAFMAGFIGDEATAQELNIAMSQINKNYKADLLIYANNVFHSDNIDDEGAIELGNEILESITGLQNQAHASSALGKLKQQYEGKKQMDKYRQGMINTLSNDKAAFLFTANNKSTVLTDTYHDFKKRVNENTELTRGQVHMRIVHEPVR